MKPVEEDMFYNPSTEQATPLAAAHEAPRRLLFIKPFTSLSHKVA